MVEKRALCVVQSWLLAWGVPHEIREGKLFVDGREATFNVDAVMSSDFAVSMGEMERLLERFGRTPATLLRTPQQRRTASDDTIGKSLRLGAFARTANPPDDLMARYAPVVKREADRAYRRSLTLSRMLLLEPRDYFVAGLVFLTLYLHRYQDLENEGRNGANLTLYLQQEFRHWDKVLHHDLPSIVLDARGMLPEQFMTAPVPGSVIDWDTYRPAHEDDQPTPEPSYTMPEYVDLAEEQAPDIHQEGDLPHHLLPELLTLEEHRAHVKRCGVCSQEKAAERDAKKRRAEARLRLTESLNNLPHDEMVHRLTFVAESPYFDFDARTLAAKLYTTHTAKCADCTAARLAQAPVAAAVA